MAVAVVTAVISAAGTVLGAWIQGRAHRLPRRKRSLPDHNGLHQGRVSDQPRASA